MKSLVTRLERWYPYRFHAVAVGLLLVFVVFSFSAVHGVHIGSLNIEGSSITYDEVSHIGSAYYYDHVHRYDLNPEHPPLVKVVAGIPLQFLSVKPGVIDPSTLTQESTQWAYGRSFLFIENGDHTSKIINTARLAVTVLNTVLLFAIFLILKRLVSVRAALLALALLIFNPVLLGHASLVTFDVPAGLTIILAILAYVYYLQSMTARRAIIAGAMLGVGLLANFTTAALAPIFLLVGAGWLIYQKSDKAVLRKWLTHQVALGIAAFLAISIFLLPFTFRMDNALLLNEFKYNWPGHLNRVYAAILTALVYLGPLTKAFAAWANGLLIIQNVVNAGKGGIVFLGHFYGFEGPGPLYYPLLYVTKLPVATALLTIGTTAFALVRFVMHKRDFRVSKQEAQLCLLLGVFSVAYLAFVIHAPFKIGIRHLFPFVIASLVLAALLADKYWDLHIVGQMLQYKHLVWAGLALMFLSNLLAFPYYISYYNTLVGGSLNGYRIAVDSNYDWGQDLSRLKAWQQANHVQTLYADLFVDPWGVEQHYLPGTIDINSLDTFEQVPEGSYVAVSATNLALREALSGNPNAYTKLYKGAPTRIGTTIFIFQRTE